jgi:hypothetical protein
MAAYKLVQFVRQTAVLQGSAVPAHIIRLTLIKSIVCKRRYFIDGSMQVKNNLRAFWLHKSSIHPLGCQLDREAL